MLLGDETGASVQLRRSDDLRLRLKPIAWPAIAPLVVAKVVLQLVTADLYGAHRDEFYYLASGHHPAWGYVDNPPLVPMLYRLQEAVLGHSVTALALVPALVGGVFIVLGALIARELGGGPFAQGLTGVVAMLGPLYLTTSHFLSTVSLDLVFWALGSWLVLRMVRTQDRRLWAVVGVVCGVGLLNKDTMGFWTVSAVLGLACTPQRKLLAGRWLLVGAGAALVIVAPNLIWEAANHWPTLEFLRNITAGNGRSNVVQFVPFQLVLVTLGGTVIWVTALMAMGRRTEFRDQRWLLVAYLVSFLLLLALEGKAYYLGSWYLPLVAVGAVAIEQRWHRLARYGVLGVVVVTGLTLAPEATPILPESTAVALHLDTVNPDLGGMLGWPQVVAEIADVFHSLPTGEQPRAVVLTGNYAEAGAVDFYGPERGLTHAISGQNSFWLWGYGDPSPGATVVAVGLPSAFVHRYWGAVTRAVIVGNGPVPIDPHERGRVVWICRRQRLPWSVLWPRTKHYD